MPRCLRFLKITMSYLQENRYSCEAVFCCCRIYIAKRSLVLLRFFVIYWTRGGPKIEVIITVGNQLWFVWSKNTSRVERPSPPYENNFRNNSKRRKNCTDYTWLFFFYNKTLHESWFGSHVQVFHCAAIFTRSRAWERAYTDKVELSQSQFNRRSYSVMFRGSSHGPSFQQCEIELDKLACI